MCGIFGVVGTDIQASEIFNGLKKLEYRGYDSSGIALQAADKVEIFKEVGRLSNLLPKIQNLKNSAVAGIGHTRWATHGAPSERNSHPHRVGKITVVHNGIIENWKALRSEFVSQGRVFLSDTDSEVAAALLNEHYKNEVGSLDAVERMRVALTKSLCKLDGAFSFSILCDDTPGTLFAVKRGSPLVIGRGEGKSYCVSDRNVLDQQCTSYLFLEENEFAIVNCSSARLFHFDGTPKNPDFLPLTDFCDMIVAPTGTSEHMYGEILEEPVAVASTLSNCLFSTSDGYNFFDFGISNSRAKSIQRIQIVGCGSSYLTGQIARYFLEEVTGLPVEVELGSEFRYKPITTRKDTLLIALSQSGETADTIQAIQVAKDKAEFSLAIINSPKSSLGVMCDSEFLLHCGPEIAVASTKTLPCHLLALHVLGLHLAQSLGSLAPSAAQKLAFYLSEIPDLLKKSLEMNGVEAKKLAEQYVSEKSILFMGRGALWGIATEGALKLKELSYIHAEAYAGGELKHGPLALIDKEMTVVCIAPKNELYEKMMSNVSEIKARDGKILGIGSRGDASFRSECSGFLEIPLASHSLQESFLCFPPLHLFSYWVAKLAGHDVDKPRNLAKSVTVE